MASDSLAKSVICLTLFVVINAVAFVVVTVIQCNNIRDLEEADADLESDFDDIFYKVEFGSDDFRRALVKAVPSGVRTKRSGLGDIFMDLLKTQESVIEAHCKDTTKICKQGDKGHAGPSGDQGLKGNHGTAGTKGARGYQGIQGIKGRHGLPGNVGANGTSGATGPQGPAGPIGQKGDPGTKGLVGPKGEPGISGVNGTKGEPGNPGLPGQAGLKGNQGTKGARGERGIPGIKGIRGGPGQKGADRDKLKVGCECLKQPTIAGPENEVRHVVYGSSATMTCNADGIPPPKITWNTKAVGSTLTVPRVTSFDYRTYQCTASNVFGTDTKNITLAN